MNEYGLCKCGCGGRTKISKHNDHSKGWVKGEPRNFCRHHHLLVTSGEKSRLWKGGVCINDAGYKLVYCNQIIRGRRRYQREHILIAEKAFGGKLPKKCEVHHAHNKSDNTRLVICQDAAYHKLLHVRARALSECGDANKKKCKYCKRYDNIANMYCYVSKLSGGIQAYHRQCRNTYLGDRKKLGYI